MKTMTHNPNCGGSHCVTNAGEVRLLPTGGGNAILCADCYAHVMAWRRERNKQLREDAQFDLPPWVTLSVHEGAGY
jgi:hypothetical protein